MPTSTAVKVASTPCRRCHYTGTSRLFANAPVRGILARMKCVIEHRTKWFAPRYEVRVAMLFSTLETAIIKQHKLYDHRIVTDLGQEVHIRDVYKRTYARRFYTPALAKTFDERFRAALPTLKGYLEFSARTPPP